MKMHPSVADDILARTSSSESGQALLNDPSLGSECR